MHIYRDINIDVQNFEMPVLSLSAKCVSMRNLLVEYNLNIEGASILEAC